MANVLPGPDPRPALARLLAAVRSSNRFYLSKLSGVPSFEPTADLGTFTRTVPFTTKAELVTDQAAHPPYGTHLTHPLSAYTRCHQTSGTTGAPLRWLDTPESWNALTEDWATVFRQAGVTAADRIFFAFSFGPFLGFWLAFEAGQRLGSLCLAGGGMSSSLRLRVLRENAATVLCCTPTYALHLAEVAAAEGIPADALPVRTLVVAGEPGGSLPATRQRLSDAWNGARVFDHHGMTETGPVTYEAPDQPGHLVVLEESFFAEVVTPGGADPVPEGQTGELILTTLRRQGSPLIRYRTGDLVRARRSPTPDGQGSRLMLEGGILGRVDDMIIIRGVNVYPGAIEELVRRIPEIQEFRVTHDTRKALGELALEVEGSDDAAKRLQRDLQDSLALRVPVTAVAPGTLPRFEMKARRWRKREGGEG